MRSVTKKQIVSALRELGLGKGDIVVVHSSLSAFGKVAGAARTVVDALLETVGKTGTLVMPSHSSDEPYDFRKSPSCMGAITQELLRRPGVARGLQPIMPAAALGPRAKELVSGHHKCACPNIGGPYDLAAAAGGYVLLLGVDQDRNTTIHTAEATVRAAYTRPVSRKYVDAKGRVRTYRGERGAGPHRDFIGLDPKLREAGVVKVARIGDCVARLMKGQELIDLCMAELEKDPAVFLTENDGYYDGIMQRGRIRAARLAAHEAFTLIARTSAAGANMEEVFWHAERAGVSALEVDMVDGRDISTLSATDLKYLKGRLAERRIRAAIVRPNILSSGAFGRALKAARTLGAAAVVCPITGPVGALKARTIEAKRARVDMLFENVGIASRDVAAMMKALGGAGLAFNPAHFAAAGELPFLQSFRALKRYIRYLAIADASPLGVACVPGNGCGEVKELISILRCSSFDGYMSLGAAPSAGPAFDDIADALYRLLDTC